MEKECKCKKAVRPRARPAAEDNELVFNILIAVEEDRILGHRIIGPYFIEDGRLSAERYEQLLLEEVGPALEDLNLNFEIWFQQMELQRTLAEDVERCSTKCLQTNGLVWEDQFHGHHAPPICPRMILFCGAF